MSKFRHNSGEQDKASPLVITKIEQWSPGGLVRHRHTRHELMYATSGVVHITTMKGEWILPPSRALWITAETEHALKVIKPAKTIVLYIDRAVSYPDCDHCMVVNVSPLIRELIIACTHSPQDNRSACNRLAQVLLDQLTTLDRIPVALPAQLDHRALKIAGILRQTPSCREPLAHLARHAGASTRTIERLWIRETGMTFGTWRQRLRLVTALEQLAWGNSITNTAFEAGYESVSAFVHAFKNMFGITPARYFKTIRTEE